MIIVFGQVTSYAIGLACGSSWRLMLGLGAVPPFLQILGMLMMPETPRWLFKQDRNEEGTNVLLKIRLKENSRDPTNIQEEVDAILTEIREEGTLTYKEQLKELITSLRKPLKLGIGLMVFQQLDGINTVMYYGPEIMKSAGFSSNNREAIIASIPVTCISLIGTIISISLVEKFGRRTIMLRTLPFLCLSMIGLSMSFLAMQYLTDSQGASISIVTFVGLYVLFFSLGMSPVPWVINSEIFLVSDK